MTHDPVTHPLILNSSTSTPPLSLHLPGMYTANTMATAIEAMGMSLPYSSSTPADDPMKIAECKMSGW